MEVINCYGRLVTEIEKNLSEEEQAVEKARRDALTASSGEWYYYPQKKFFDRRLRGLSTDGILAKPAAAKRHNRCGNCGATDHFARDCARDVECFKCGELGHFARKCPYSASEARERRERDLEMLDAACGDVQ